MPHHRLEQILQTKPRIRSYSGQSTGDDCSTDTHLVCILSITEITVPLSRAVSSLNKNIGGGSPFVPWPEQFKIS